LALRASFIPIIGLNINLFLNLGKRKAEGDVYRESGYPDPREKTGFPFSRE
jgi:hypothetical protein